MNKALDNFEHFLHDKKLPMLIRAALAHEQFETIHPFLDGNGRLGRLLITFMLCAEGALKQPMLYLSLYFKQRRQQYYDLLQGVRDRGDWETWVDVFLTGVTGLRTKRSIRRGNFWRCSRMTGNVLGPLGARQPQCCACTNFCNAGRSSAFCRQVEN